MKRLFLHALRICGGFALARAASSRMARILMYHNFSAQGEEPSATSTQVVREQFEYLRRHFQVVPLTEIADRLASARSISPYAVALTIDDGRRNCYELLYPLLREFAFPATFFVVSSFIRGADWIWTDKVTWLSEQPNSLDELTPRRLGETFSRLNRLHPEERNRRIQSISAAAGLSLPEKAPAKYAPCTWSELREMSNSGLVEIGSHTVTHPILSSITDEESWQELTESRREISQELGNEVRSFCLPNGMPEDFRPSQIRQIQQAGYTCSVLADFGLVGGNSDPYQMRRIGMGRKAKALEIAKYLDGAEYYKQKIANLFGRRVTLETELS